MNLTPREKDKLLISMAAMVARRRLERGVKLNHPEAIALISDFVVEGARDGRTVSELMRDIMLVFRMDVLPLAEVGNHGLAGIGQLHRLRLRLAEFRPVAIAGAGLLGFEVRQLHPIERKIALRLLPAPFLDQEREQGLVLVGPARIVFALIPNHTFYAVTKRWIDHSSEYVSRPVLAAEVVIGLARRRHVLRPRLRACRFPLGCGALKIGLSFFR